VKKRNKNNALKQAKFASLATQTWQELTAFWRPLFGVTLVYLVLYFIFVLGFNVSYSYQDIVASVALQIGENASWLPQKSVTVLNVFGSGFSGQSDASTVMQFLLFIIATMAIIWTLRSLRALKHIKIRTAYYEGPAQFVPFILVVFLLFLTLLPSAIGSAIFGVAQLTGAQGLELTLAGVLAAALFFGSVYLFCAWFPALYIVSLPKGTPIKSMKLAWGLTKGKRFWLVRTLVSLAILLALSAFLSIFLVVLILPVVSVFMAFIVSFAVFTVAQTFMYITYRSMIDD
jgi:hypothetical protein